MQVGFDSSWPPFSHIDASGHPAGITADYLAYLSRTLGVAFNRARQPDWPSTIDAFQRGELAILTTGLEQRSAPSEGAAYPCIRKLSARDGRSRRRARRTFALAIFAARRASWCRRMSRGGSARVPTHPEGPPAIAPSLDEALRMVASGEADVVVENVAAVDTMLKRQYSGVSKDLGTVGESDALDFAVRPDLSPLAGLIDRALLADAACREAAHPAEMVTGNAPGNGYVERDWPCAPLARADRHRCRVAGHVARLSAPSARSQAPQAN